MANIKISDLPPATLPLDDPNTLFEVTVLEAGEEVSRKITLADIASGGGGQVDSVVSGTNITVDATDPVNPIVNLDAAITGVSVNGVTLDATGVATNFLDETGAYSVPAGGGGANVVAGTVDGQVTIWDIGNNQYEPVISSSILINPATPPTSPLGRISGGGSSTTDVRKAFIHVNIGASAGPVWSTDRNGGTPVGFYGRSAFNFSPIHDWGFWNPGNQTGLTIFSITEDLEFIHEQSAFFEERAAGLASVAARGQVWVRDDVPNVLMYTDDAGTDFVLNGTGGVTVEDEGVPLATIADTLDFVGAGVTATGAGGTKTITIPGAGGGDVFKVGTPVDNQVGVWTGDGTIEGDENFLWDGTMLSLLSASGVIGLDFFSDAATGTFRTQGSNISRWIMSGWDTGGPTIFLNTTGAENGFSISASSSSLDNRHNVHLSTAGGGAARLEIGAQPFDGTSAASVDFGRRTDTTSGIELRLFRGDDSVIDEITLGGTLTSAPGVNIKEGLPLIIQALSGGGKFDSSHDNVDFNTIFTTTTDWNITGLSGRIKQDAETLAFVSEIGGGDVSKVGTPVDNQVGVWTGDGTIEGTTGLTYDGSDLDITGNITLTGNVDGINIAVDVPANTAKVTNATHTGQVTGATALALDVTAITAQPASGAIAAGDTIITNDGGVLSEATFTQLLTFFDANLSFLAFSEFQFFADQLENPNNADWTVNALAPASADSNNAGLTVRLFDDTTEEGVGFTIEVPAGATNIVFDFVARAETAPGIANTVGLDIYNRGIPDNAAVQAWSAATQLTDIDIPTNEFFQEDTQTVTLATLGVTAGETTQFELTRVAPTGGTDLTGDWAMLLVKVSFT